MSLSEGVVVGASSNTAVGQVAELVNVEAMKTGSEAGELSLDADLLSNLLHELDGASDSGGAVQNAHSVVGGGC